MGVAKLRKEAGLTYKQLAELAGVNYQKIWQIEHGIINPERLWLKTALKLANAFKCEVEELLEPDDE